MITALLQPLRAAGLAGIVLVTTAAACGERVQGEPHDDPVVAAAAAEAASDAAPAPPPVDPCALLTRQEISEQLLLTLSPSEVSNLTTKEFEVTPTEVPWGESRRCEFKYASMDRSRGGPLLRGDFNVMVSPIAFVDAIRPRDRQPVAGAGSEIFKYEKMGERAFYVTKGKYGASLTDFRGTHSPSGTSPDAGRVALLRRIAERLP
jgi:hypothetical protein